MVVRSVAVTVVLPLLLPSVGLPGVPLSIILPLPSTGAVPGAAVPSVTVESAMSTSSVGVTAVMGGLFGASSWEPLGVAAMTLSSGRGAGAVGGGPCSGAAGSSG